MTLIADAAVGQVRRMRADEVPFPSQTNVSGAFVTAAPSVVLVGSQA